MSFLGAPTSHGRSLPDYFSFQLLSLRLLALSRLANMWGQLESIGSNPSASGSRLQETEQRRHLKHRRLEPSITEKNTTDVCDKRWAGKSSAVRENWIGLATRRCVSLRRLLRLFGNRSLDSVWRPSRLFKGQLPWCLCDDHSDLTLSPSHFTPPMCIEVVPHPVSLSCGVRLATCTLRLPGQ